MCRASLHGLVMSLLLSQLTFCMSNYSSRIKALFSDFKGKLSSSPPRDRAGRALSAGSHFAARAGAVALALVVDFFYMDILGAARFDFQIYSDGPMLPVGRSRRGPSIIISTAGCMIASSSAFWWCSGSASTMKQLSQTWALSITAQPRTISSCTYLSGQAPQTTTLLYRRLLRSCGYRATRATMLCPSSHCG